MRRKLTTEDMALLATGLREPGYLSFENLSGYSLDAARRTSPYKRGDVVTYIDGEKLQRGAILAVLSEYMPRRMEHIPKYVIVRQTKAGIWAKQKQYLYPGFIQSAEEFEKENKPHSVRYEGDIPKTLRAYCDTHAGCIEEVSSGGGYTTNSGHAYDVLLRAGWKVSGDSVHGIIEETVAATLAKLRYVVRCDCDACAREQADASTEMIGDMASSPASRICHQ